MIILEESIVHPLPSEALIAKRERFWRVTLPKDYKAFIMKYNGSIPQETAILTDEENYCIERFLCILENYKESDSGWYDISVVDTQIGERLTADEDLVGMELVPIAQLTGEHYVCLDYRENPDNPCICIWDNDESGEFDPVTYRIADSFTEFVNMVE